MVQKQEEQKKIAPQAPTLTSVHVNPADNVEMKKKYDELYEQSRRKAEEMNKQYQQQQMQQSQKPVT